MVAPPREIFERAEISSAEKHVIYTFDDAALSPKLLGLGLGFFDGGVENSRGRLFRRRVAR